MFVAAGYRQVAFADPLKVAAAVLLQRSLEWIEAHKRDVEPPESMRVPVRTFLQRLGDFARDLGSEDVFLRRVQELWAMCPDRGLVVSDVRMSTEAAWLKSAGGILIYIRRPTAVLPLHRSEALPLSLAHYVVNNTGTLAEFKECIAQVGRDAGLL